MQRFWDKVEKTDDCWLWRAGRYPKGYGRFQLPRGTPNRDRLAHRVAYEMLVGPIPDGLTIDHLCGNRLCVNPAHMEIVTRSENSRRGNPRQTQCKNGHDFSGENIYELDGRRRCRPCRREYMAHYYARRQLN